MTSDTAGGGEFAAVNMLDALSRRGHETVLLTNHAGVADGRAVAVRAIELGPKLSGASYRSLAARSATLWARLRQHLDRESPYDVLVAHFKKEQLLSAALPRRLRAKLVWAEWGPVPRQMRSGRGRWAYRTAASRAELVLAVSPGTRESVCAVGVPANRVHVVPNALPVPESYFSETGRVRVRQANGIPLDAPVVGCVSRLHARKRNDVAVDAVVRLGRDDVHLVVAGEGEAESDLRSRARPLGDRAHFLPTPGRQIADVCSSFDVSVFCPSPTEGAPLAVIHSMLASRPCLATADEGVAGLIVPGAGAISSPEHDPAALAALLRDYLDDPDRRAREGATAHSIAGGRFAAPIVAAQIEALISQ
ncbi:MAG TPA: glycosyltransferase family 4 protein [Solirubrobacteraceae bacterium]|nr:glycosyltransferase family 4 protein [Solirubrobacteraceae bacterium]